MAIAYFGDDDREYYENSHQLTGGLMQGAARHVLAVVVFAMALASYLMLASFSPEDPSHLNVTNNNPNNALGFFGAYVAAVLIELTGRAAMVIPIVLLIWSVRLFLGMDGPKFFNRILLLPLGVIISAGFAASWVLSPDWYYAEIGMGGMLGDAILSAALDIVPLAPQAGLFVMTLALGALSLFSLALISGFSLHDIASLIGRIFNDVGYALFAIFGFLLAPKARMKAAEFASKYRRRGRGERQEPVLSGGDETGDIAHENGHDRHDHRNDHFAANQLTLDIGTVFDEPSFEPDWPEKDLRPAAPPHYEDHYEDIGNAGGGVRASRGGGLLGGLLGGRLLGFGGKGRGGKYSRRTADGVEGADHFDQYDAASGGGRGHDARPRNVGEMIDEVVGRKLSRHQRLLRRSTHGEGEPYEADPIDEFEAGFEAGIDINSGQPEHYWGEGFEDERIDGRDPGGAQSERRASKGRGAQGGEDYPGPVYARTTGGVGMPARSNAQPHVSAQAHKKPAMSKRARKEAEPKFPFDESARAEFEQPPLSLLQNPSRVRRLNTPKEALEASASQLEAVLFEYGVRGDIVAIRPGPVVTMFELEPAAGLKASRVVGLADDIARSMSALTARVATIPGRSVIGIEIPNDNRELVLLREIFSSKPYGDSKFALPLALGKDIAGDPVVVNLAKMPHLLIAGTTGSGKSVAINTMILSLLYHATPDQVRMIMIDPKMLELSVYDGVPHLLSPVVTDPKKAVVALKWVVGEMEERYRKMSRMGVRNIDSYNARVDEALSKGEAFCRTVQTGFDDETGEPIFESREYEPEKMPYIVVVVDEMADLMMVAGKEIEACIQRLAQMARASGIHLIMATQRPSVDVITGTIKANFPTRISFQVTSKIDSRTILGEMGAEQLLGQGDMLYMSGGGRITRIHGPFVSDREVEEVVHHLKAQGEPEYVAGVVSGEEGERAENIDAVLGLGASGDEDTLYDQAVAIIARDRKCSTSYIQRKLAIGYNKAARLVERMEDEGVVSTANHIGKREVLVAEI